MPIYHTCALRIRGNGRAGQQYQLKLVSAIFLKVYPRPQARMIVWNLPMRGEKMIYQ